MAEELPSRIPEPFYTAPSRKAVPPLRASILDGESLPASVSLHM